MITNRSFFVLLTLSFLVQSLSLFNQGIFWDDWVTFYISFDGLMTTYRSAGFPLTGYIHDFLRTWGPIGYRVVVLSATVITVMCFYFILSSLKLLEKKQVQILTLFFSFAPLNFAKWSAINCPSMIHLTLFFIGFYFLVQFLMSGKALLRLLSIAFLFLSFPVNSLLVFYYAAFVLTLISLRIITADKANWFKTVLRLPDFFLVPIVYWLWKGLFFKPYGNYANYNAVTISSLLKAALKSWQTIWYSWADPIFVSLSSGFIGGLILLLLFLIIFRKSLFANVLHAKSIFIVGLLLFIAAGIPYLAVGKVPRLEDWHSRHQILMPAGFSLMTLGFCGLVFKRYAGIALYFLLGCFIWIQIASQIGYIVDYGKQQALIDLIKTNSEVKAEHLFNIDDQAKDWNVLSRAIRFYEFSGWFRQAFGDQSRLAVLKDEMNLLKSINSDYFKEEYNLKDYAPTSRMCSLLITADRKPTWYEAIFNKEQMHSLIHLQLIGCTENGS